MKITIIASGSRGDVQPYVALGKGLKAAGHIIHFLSSPDFSTLITDHGLDFVDMGGGSQALAQSHFKELAEEGNLLKMLAGTGKGAQQLAQQAAKAGLHAAQDADLIIGGLGGLAGGLAVAERLRVPFVQAYLIPFTPTRHFPSPVMPLPQTPLTRWANHLSHRLTRQMMWQMLRKADNEARTQVLDMTPAPFWGPFNGAQPRNQPLLYGYSPHVLPPPADWTDSVHVTGYWFLESHVAWTPPAALVEFLQAGPPPVYVGFGSMPSRDPAETAALVLQALDRTGQRGVLYKGWGGLQQAQLPETVLMVDSVPHSWLFPRMAAVVHHGGAGTTAAGLRAGVPSIVTPFFGDQPFWGRRVHALGVGPKPIRRRRLTAVSLAEAIHQAVTDTAMRQRAADLGAHIRAEDGVARAVAVIERFAATR